MGNTKCDSSRRNFIRLNVERKSGRMNTAEISQDSPRYSTDSDYNAQICPDISYPALRPAGDPKHGFPVS